MLANDRTLADALERFAEILGWQIPAERQLDVRPLAARRLRAAASSELRRDNWLDLHLAELAAGPDALALPAATEVTSQTITIETRAPLTPAERDARGQWFDAAAGFATYVSAPAHGATYVVHTGDRRIGRRLYASQHRGEMETVDTVVAILRDRALLEQALAGSFLDIGANIGTSTVHALINHGFAGAVACEPAPENMRMLRMNLEMNGLGDRTSVFEVALSDQAGSIDLDLSPENWGDHRVVPTDGDDLSRGGKRLRVRRTTVDRLVASRMKTRAPGLLWVDVQGHEAAVLRGAEGLRSAGVPSVIEFYPKLLKSRQSVRELEQAIKAVPSVVIDLRTVAGDGGKGVPSDEIQRLSSRYLRSGRVTDLLLLPLEPDGV